MEHARTSKKKNIHANWAGSPWLTDWNHHAFMTDADATMITTYDWYAALITHVERYSLVLPFLGTFTHCPLGTPDGPQSRGPELEKHITRQVNNPSRQQQPLQCTSPWDLLQKQQVSLEAVLGGLCVLCGWLGASVYQGWLLWGHCCSLELHYLWVTRSSWNQTDPSIPLCCFSAHFNTRHQNPHKLTQKMVIAMSV